MDNVKTTVAGNKLTVEIDLDASFGESAEGKSIIIASSRGGKPVEGTDGLVLSLNCYKPLPKQPKAAKRR